MRRRAGLDTVARMTADTVRLLSTPDDAPSDHFVDWLSRQLRATRMSQRQLAHRSGVSHSTISRLLTEKRVPSLGTATKIARALPSMPDDGSPPYRLGGVDRLPTHPTARVEYALRADDLFGEPEVRQVMAYYLALRARRGEAA